MKTLLSIIIIVVIFLIIYKNDVESFIPWSIPTRNMPLYYDIRGDPNIVYTKMLFGGYEPYGYLFGPHVYDVQGNFIEDVNGAYYIV